ncbi:ASFV G ACD 00350 [African swine fever virus]
MIHYFLQLLGGGL